MAKVRTNQRGVTSLVTCAVLMLFGVLGLAAGCSSPEGGADPEVLESVSQPQFLGECDVDCAKLSENNPCGTFACDKLTGTCKPDKVLIKEGGLCAKGLTCHLNLCCAGCVVVGKRATPLCAPRGGIEDVRCGANGENCSDCTADACQLGSCENKACVLKPIGDGDPCTKGGGACLKGACCRGCRDSTGACQPGGALDNCGVSDTKLVDCKNCTDDQACTAEACVSGACQYPAVPEGTSCDDGDKCNGEESCNGTSCEKGKPLDCDDGESCTKDSCGPNGCIHDPLTGDKCSDGDPCTTGDKCGDDGKCAKGTPINCDDGQFCTNDSCKDGACLHDPKAITTTCDDGNMCSTADKCTAEGKCLGTSATSTNCDDGNPCTIDKQPDCTMNICTHDTFAPSTTACIADKCHQAGQCSGVDGTCVPGPAIDCDDANPCTVDTCTAKDGCVNTNDASQDCSDADPCTENDVCVKGSCGGKPKVCLALDACHEPGKCDGATGTCNDPRSEDGKPCPGGACKNGSCILDPNAGVGGEGAGGEGGADVGVGLGGDGTVVTGGTGGTTPMGEAGQPSTPGEGEGGAPEPDKPFTRKPGGCSCEVPATDGHGRPAALLGLAFLAVALRRRSRRGRAAA